LAGYKLWADWFIGLGLIPEQNSGEYNPMYQLVYDQQIMPHPTKPPDLTPKTASVVPPEDGR
jgi:hypothetical protein